MKRKVIQIANSTTQLVSLPRAWTQSQGLKKGDEVEVTVEGSSIRIDTEKSENIERIKINLEGLGVMAPRMIYALYKKGIDEIEIPIKSTEEINIIKASLNNETVGYEIIEQSSNHCLIKNISGQTESFDYVLRRIFRLMIAMSEEGLHAVKEKNVHKLKNAVQLENTNNRLTTICRRYLNKTGKTDYPKICPLYYIVEELENIADQYKYMLLYLEEHNLEKVNLSSEFIKIYESLHELLDNTYKVIYKFDAKMVAVIGEARKDIIKRCYTLMKTSKNRDEVIACHNLLVLAQRIFSLIGPHMINAI